ncbi:histidine phosphatase family protein [Marinilongibacter aquaticus]|uniref:SixA phosphatase family protein n=1 Tax=Marinilongibacter aquaticus TaxID=2975157 RepID=UPI0021BD082B|nr:histidine phosphatase family protein [Marinilongibacter aquaticus]UBM57964.1 histidine phosphatase family protein [Marinilongibacter aquaticus]
MTKSVLLIRHAKAEDLGFTAKDIDRNLTSQGIMQSAKLGKLLFEEGCVLDRAISSPANRAFQTAKVVFEQLKRNEEEIKVDAGLYGSGPKGYLAALNAVGDDKSTVALFGHNPDISFFAEYLTRDDIMGSMKKATLIEIEFGADVQWAEISGNMGTVRRRVDVASLT